MLTLSFFTAVFSSILWLIYSFFYLSVQLAGNSFETLNLVDMAISMFVVFTPLFVIWFFWEKFRNFNSQKRLNKQITILSSQISQNQEYTEAIARILLQTSEQQKHSVAMQQINFYISEMNEILVDILQRYELLPEKDIYNTWKTVGLGNRWGFAKAFADLQNNSFVFQNQLQEKAKYQPLLLSSLKEFCARYTRLLNLLTKHDEENILQETVESGAFGRVFVMFSNIINNQGDISSAKQDIYPDSDSSLSATSSYADNENNFTPEERVKTGFHPVKKILKKFHKSPEPELEDKILPDSLSLALERSFGATHNDTPAEPKIEAPSNNFSASSQQQDSYTQSSYLSNGNRSILSLQKEWEELNSLSNTAKEIFADEK
ncbi:MAG: hypothetical protein J6T72_00665 [Alphaproteobacteria bacterium]|nr:hypothetical protein [Alphaproteobacteria bacterium]